MADESAKENALLSISTDLDCNKRCHDSPIEPEAKKKKIDSEEIECVELTSDVPGEEDLDRTTPSQESSTSTSKTPVSSKKQSRTPKVSKEEREAERLRKLELKKQREEERERARLEKERIAEEKRQERERKEREREEKRKEEEKKKEEKRKADEERAEKKRLEEEEKQRRREEIARKKREEEEKKEAKRREEEERREQKRREEEAEEERKRRASARFIGFFKAEKKNDAKKAVEVEKEPNAADLLWYRPFQIKPGMSLAPLHRRDVLQMSDDVITQKEDVTASTYLLSDACKKRKIVGYPKIELRAKLFQFHDNYRPPYYGTWRKRNPLITGRRPWSTAADEIDYEVDSDAEWEDEPSDAEECKSDEEDPEDEEMDSDHCEFFVEPGYLSDGEGADDDEQGRDAEDSEARAARLAARAADWKQRVLAKPKLLVPRCLGPFYNQIPEFLEGFKATVLP